MHQQRSSNQPDGGTSQASSLRSRSIKMVVQYASRWWCCGAKVMSPEDSDYDTDSDLSYQPTVSTSLASTLSNLSASTSSFSYSLTEVDANDFIFKEMIGEGSFSTVYLAKNIHNKKDYAIKVCSKRGIIRKRQTVQIQRERDILLLLTSNCKKTAPFFVKIYSSFQNQERLFFVLTYAKNRDLIYHIHKVGNFGAACTQFYAGEILHALEHMHSLGVIHRDLKPENIVLDQNMHILITDFGCAKIMTNHEPADEDQDNKKSTTRRYSFVGTAEYISPEVLTETRGCSRASDLWAFGAIIYQMLTGKLPFKSSNENLLFKKIKTLQYEFPEGFPPNARALIESLLVIDPQQRIGSADGDVYTSIRSHPFFEGVILEHLFKQTPPPMHPNPLGAPGQKSFRRKYWVPDNLDPGLDDHKIARMHLLYLSGTSYKDPGSLIRQRTGPNKPNLQGISYLGGREIDEHWTLRRGPSPDWMTMSEFESQKKD